MESEFSLLGCKGKQSMGAGNKETTQEMHTGIESGDHSEAFTGQRGGFRAFAMSTN